MSRKAICITMLGLLAVAAGATGLEQEARDRQASWLLIAPERCQQEVDQAVSSRALDRRERRSSLKDRGQVDLRPDDGVLRQLAGMGAEIRTVSAWLNAVSVDADASLLAELAELPFVLATRPVARYHRVEAAGSPPPTGSFDRLEYGPSAGQLEMLRVPEAHDQGLSGAGVLVLMLDTGYYKDHVSLDSTRIVAEWDFINNDGNTQNEGSDDPDQHRHGTATASALGGAWSGNLYGPAYACDFLLAKTEDVTSETPVEEDYYAAALEWGEALGADLASSSLGYTDWYTWEDLNGETALVTQAVNMAVELGLAVVTSAGNYRASAWGHIGTPADAFGVISVGAVYSDETFTYFSSPGPSYDGRIKPEVSAQGYSVAAAGVGAVDDLQYFAGTSLSCPLVAGCAALLLEAHPDWNPAELRWALMSTADRAENPDNDYGWGIIDVMAALDAEPHAGPLLIEASGSDMRLSWPQSPFHATRVYWSLEANGPWTLATTTRDTSWTDAGAIAAPARFYRISGQ